nr:hypothetical protein [Tanacetum cinerariifolium]
MSGRQLGALLQTPGGNEAVNEEMDDSLERAATTTTSLNAEQDRGNISKTQSKATPNDPNSQGTSSGGGPRCQEAIGDAVAQTMSERVSKNSNDPLLAKVNTPRSGEDSLKLTKLMELCNKLQQRVLDLETTKTTQALEIDSLKKRQKVESFEDEGLGEEDASKHGWIANIDANEDITLVSTHDEQMFDANQDLGSEEVFVAQQDENIVEKEVDAVQIQVTTVATTPTISIDEVTLAQELAELKHTKPKAKAKRIIFHEPEESTTTTTTAAIPKPKSQDKELQAEFKKEQRLSGERAQQELEANIALIESWDDVQAKINADYQEKDKVLYYEESKRKEEQTTNTSSTKKNNVYLPQEHERKEAYRFEEQVEESSKKAEEEVTEGSYKRVRTKLEQESAKKQKIDDDKDTTELQQLVKIIPYKEGVAIDAIPLAVKPLSIVDWKIQKEGKKSYYKIIKADGSLKIYLIFSHMLKDFDREDVETLWKLVKAKYGSIRPEGDYETVLWGNLKVMFDPHVEDEVWKMQQRYNVVRWTLFNSCGVHCLSL